MVCDSKRLFFFYATLPHTCAFLSIVQCFSGVSLIAIHVYSLGDRGGGYLDKGLVGQGGRGWEDAKVLLLYYWWRFIEVPTIQMGWHHVKMSRTVEREPQLLRC